jgi:hypothetical protein
MLEPLKGFADYLCRPGLKKARWNLARAGVNDGGPFNSQRGRTVVVRQIIDAMDARAIVETGTHRGTTTEFFSKLSIPVHSVEIQPRLHAYSRIRLRAHHNVVLHLGDSADVLRMLAHDSTFPNQRVFFYLDAHSWDNNPPLDEELALVFGNWSEAVVMIDDFAVPGDSYGYLDMGPGRCLDEAALQEQLHVPRFYPAMPAYQETGYNTGWVVLASGTSADRLADLPGLRRQPVRGQTDAGSDG